MKFIRSEEGAHKFNRWLFFGSNAFFWTLGWWFLVIGMWIYSDRHEYAILARASFNPLSSAGICLGCGLTVIIIGFVGVLGAWFENKLLLVLYISFVGFLFFVELTTGTLGFILRGRVAENVKMDLLYNINSTYVSKNHADSYGVRLTWDHLQSTLKCCGSNNYTNWFKSVYWPKNNFVPDSCCDVSFFKNNESMANCGQNYEHRDMWYQRGCYEVFTDWLLRHGKIIVIFSYIFVIADALALITAVRVYLFIRCREKNNEVGYRYKKGNNLDSVYYSLFGTEPRPTSLLPTRIAFFLLLIFSSTVLTLEVILSKFQFSYIPGNIISTAFQLLTRLLVLVGEAVLFGIRILEAIGYSSMNFFSAILFRKRKRRSLPLEHDNLRGQNRKVSSRFGKLSKLMKSIFYRNTPSQAEYTPNLMHFERLQMRRCTNRNHALFGRNIRCRTCYPSPRSGHRMFCDNGYIYVLGGYNPQRGGNSLIQDLWAFNVYTDEWTLVKVDGKFPDEMASFSVAQNEAKNCTFMFGGTAVPFGRRASNKLYVLIRCGRFDHWRWQEVPTTGEDRPDPVYGQSMIYVEGDGIYIIGGTTGFQYNMDVYKLKQPAPGPLTEKMLTMEWEWSFEKSGAAEIGRYRHEMVPVNDGFLIIGGGTPNTSLRLDTLLMYNVEKKCYEERATKQDATYGYPYPRRCHALVRCGNNAYVVGGCKDTLVPLEDMPDLGRVELMPLDDLWSLDLTTYEWRLLSATLKVPVFFHAAALTRDGCLYTFGGCNDRNSTIRSDRLERVWLRTPTLLHLSMKHNAHRFRRLFREYDANFLQSQFSSVLWRAAESEKLGHIPEPLGDFYSDTDESDSDSD